MPSEPEKRLSDGIFACNSNADGQNQDASESSSGASKRVNLGLTQERRRTSCSTKRANIRSNCKKQSAIKCRLNPKKGLQTAFFACNSNADGQNQGASDAVIWCVQAREFGADARTSV
ncbi:MULTISPECIES: hypothetical protein [Neisseria]|uniref:hypothetical protein n=1 Tax=Neisseria TaxID=482 RepID=UPI002658F83A|nr:MULTISPECIES: hypothetical protein [Neisseria]